MHLQSFKSSISQTSLVVAVNEICTLPPRGFENGCASTIFQPAEALWNTIWKKIDDGCMGTLYGYETDTRQHTRQNTVGIATLRLFEEPTLPKHTTLETSALISMPRQRCAVTGYDCSTEGAD